MKEDRSPLQSIELPLSEYDLIISALVVAAANCKIKARDAKGSGFQSYINYAKECEALETKLRSVIIGYNGKHIVKLPNAK